MYKETIEIDKETTMRMRMRWSAAVLGGAMAVAMTGAMAQTPKASSGQENHALGKVVRAEGTPDQTFLKGAIEGSHGAIDAAKMALRKSKNDQVKQFAQRMVDDHTKLLADLHQVEQGQALKYPDTSSAKAKQMARKLLVLKGAAFDKAYVNGMVKDHEEDVRDFQTEAETGQNAAIKGAAEKSLPMLQEHLGMVEGLQKSVG